MHAGFAVKCHLVPKYFLIWRFCYAKEKPVLVSVPVPIVSTVPPKVLGVSNYIYNLEPTVPQVSDCCPLGRLVITGNSKYSIIHAGIRNACSNSNFDRQHN